MKIINVLILAMSSFVASASTVTLHRHLKGDKKTKTPKGTKGNNNGAKKNSKAPKRRNSGLKDMISHMDELTSSTPCPPGQKNFTLALTTDDKPDETSWDLIDLNTGGQVLSGTDNADTTCINETQEYKFTIYDDDVGICCGYGYGSYRVLYDNELIKEGGEFGASDSFAFGPSCPITGQKRFILALATDEYPEQTSWDLINLNTGDKVLNGTDNADTTCIDETQEYEFTIYDSIGDGICCDFGEGSYQVSYDNELIKEGGEFDYSETIVFGKESKVPKSGKRTRKLKRVDDHAS